MCVANDAGEPQRAEKNERNWISRNRGETAFERGKDQQSLLPWKPQKIACEAEGVIRTYEAFYLREVRSVFGNTAEK